MLAAVFNLYEGLVIGLAWWLTQRGLRRPARVLWWVALLLLADTTFLYNELAIASWAVGAPVVAVAAGLAGLKLVLIVRGGVEGGLRPSQWATAVAGLQAVFALPVALRLLGESGRLPAAATLGMWWLLAAVAMGFFTVVLNSRGQSRGPGRGMALWVVGVPMLSLLLHVATAHWVFNATLTPAHLAPLLLGLSVALLIGCERGRLAARVWATAFGVLAVLMAGSSGYEWEGVGVLTLTPARVLCGVAVLAYALVWWQQRTLGLLAGVATLLLVSVMGATPADAVERVLGYLQWITTRSPRLLPRSVQAWGILLVTLAFAALGLGGLRAMHRPTGKGRGGS